MKRSIVIINVFVFLFAIAAFYADDVSAQSPKSILIGGGRTADPWYPLSQALAKFINEKSKWLKAEVVSTAGITATSEMIRENPKKYIGISCFDQIHFRPGHEFGEKRGTYTGDRFIAIGSTMTQCFVTYDPTIKSVKDLAGKTVDVGRKGAANTPDHIAILKAYGVLDQVKLVYTGYGGGANKMMDGLVDATMMIFDHTYPHKFSKGALVEKLEIKNPLYYVGFDRQTLMDLREKEYATLPVRIPAKVLSPKTQLNDIWAYNDPTYFMADQNMDDDVVYEVTRVIWETPASEWAKWHPIGHHMTDTYKAAVPSLKQTRVHPGAKKYYDEKGIEIKDLAELLK